MPAFGYIFRQKQLCATCFQPGAMENDDFSHAGVRFRTKETEGFTCFGSFLSVPTLHLARKLTIAMFLLNEIIRLHRIRPVAGGEASEQWLDNSK